MDTYSFYGHWIRTIEMKGMKHIKMEIKLHGISYDFDDYGNTTKINVNITGYEELESLTANCIIEEKGLDDLTKNEIDKKARLTIAKWLADATVSKVKLVGINYNFNQDGSTKSVTTSFSGYENGESFNAVTLVEEGDLDNMTRKEIVAASLAKVGAWLPVEETPVKQ